MPAPAAGARCRWPPMRLTPAATTPDPPPAPATRSCGRGCATLPDKQRTAVALRFVADAAYAEIATVMDTSEQAARRNVHEGAQATAKGYPP